MKIYLINSTYDAPMTYGPEVFRKIDLPVCYLAELSLPTVAAMVPEDMKVELCDENMGPIDFDTKAEVIGIAGRISQVHRIKEIVKEFRKRNKIIMIGGPLATLNPELIRDHCDILIRGEMEEIASKVFKDIKNGTWKKEYFGTQPNPIISPLPRWDLYPNDKALIGTLQTSRGCKFNCEFCEVVQYMGHKIRHKNMKQILDELEVLYVNGYRFIFLVDDNLTANANMTKRILKKIKLWADKKAEPVFFLAQVSIEITTDEEMIELLAEAGVINVFVGIETPSEENLKITNKSQNLDIDFQKAVQTFLDKGIMVMCGIVVGFDGDNVDSFQTVTEFGMSLPVPLYNISALMAPDNTPLWHRLKKEGRLLDDYSAYIQWKSNMIPKHMTNEELTNGTIKLVADLYDPKAFAIRINHFAKKIVPNENLTRIKKRKQDKTILFNILRHLMSSNAEEKQLCKTIFEILREKPTLAPYIFPMVMNYAQVKYMLGSINENPTTKRRS